MKKRFKVGEIQGEITVTYTRQNREWICRVLQFDLIGTGKTKARAFAEMSGNLELYVRTAIFSDGKCEFFHLADESEWNNKDKEQYRMILIFETENGIPRVFPTLERIRKYRSKIRDYDLVPTGVIHAW